MPFVIRVSGDLVNMFNYQSNANCLFIGNKTVIVRFHTIWIFPRALKRNLNYERMKANVAKVTSYRTG